MTERKHRELLPCPFCGREAETRYRRVSCSNRDCGAAFSYWSLSEWNRRSAAAAATSEGEKK